jgi:hypothetical protein
MLRSFNHRHSPNQESLFLQSLAVTKARVTVVKKVIHSVEIGVEVEQAVIN